MEKKEINLEVINDNEPKIESDPDSKIEQIELEAKKNKVDARAEILHNHRIAFISCSKDGFYDDLLVKSGKIEKAVADQIRETSGISDYEWFLRALGWNNERDRKRFEQFNAVEDGKNLPTSDDYSGFIIGGSMHMVSEDLEWMKNLQKYIREMNKKGAPFLGVCFGHQMIAKSFGGKVEATSKREIGTVNINLTEEGKKDELFRNLPKDGFNVQQSHKESVIELGEGTVSLAFNSHNLNQVIKAGDNIRGVQFHPEVNKLLLETAVELHKENIKQEGTSLVEILRSISGTPHAEEVIKNFEKYFVLKFSDKK